MDDHDIVITDKKGKYILAYAHEDILSRYVTGLMEEPKGAGVDDNGLPEGHEMIEGLKRIKYSKIDGWRTNFQPHGVEAFHYVLVFAYSPDDFPFYDLCSEGANEWLFVSICELAFLYNIEELKEGLFDGLKSFRDLTFISHLFIRQATKRSGIASWEVEITKLCKKIILEDFAEWNAIRFSGSEEYNDTIRDSVLDHLGTPAAQEAFVRLIQKVVRGEQAAQK